MSILVPDREHKQSDDVEVLIPEARARQRHRRLIVGIVLLVTAVGGLIAGLVIILLPSPPSTTALQELFRNAVRSSNETAYVHIEQTNYFAFNSQPPETVTTDGDPLARLSRMTSSDGGFLFFKTIQTRSEGYVRYSFAPNVSVHSGMWFRYPLGVISHPTPAPWAVMGVSGRVTPIGTRVIDGVLSTGYRFTVSVPLLIAQSHSKAAQWEARTSYLDQGVKSFPSELWISSSGRIREIWWSFKPRDGITNTAVQIHSYGTIPVHITLPPAAHTTDVANLAQAINDAYRANVTSGSSRR